MKTSAVPTTVLVTGGAGFIGSHIVDHWQKKGLKVVVVDNLSTGRKEWLSSGVDHFNFDLNKIDQLSQLIFTYQPNIIYHFAGHTRLREALEEPVQDAKDNLMSTVSLIQACLCAQKEVEYVPSQLIFASTSAVYAGNKFPPFSELSRQVANSPYGIAKLSAEAYVEWYHRISGVTTTILRYGNVYGPRQSSSGEAGVIAKFIDAAIKNEPLCVYGTGKHVRDYIHINDVVSANAMVADQRVQGTFVVGTGVATSTNDLVQLFQHLRPQITVTHKQHFLHEQSRSWLNSSKMTEITHWKPKVTLQTGLASTLEWYESYVQK